MAVVIPVLFSIAAEPTQNLPYFTKTLCNFRPTIRMLMIHVTTLQLEMFPCPYTHYV